MDKVIKDRIDVVRCGEIPNGYCRTMAGLMPLDWRINLFTKDVFYNYTNKKHNGEFEVLSATQDRGIIPRSEVDIDIKYSEGNKGSYKKVDPGDFIISLRSFQGGIEYSEYEGIISPAYTVLKPKLPISNHYYRAYFKTSDFINRLNGAIYGIRDGKQIGFDDFGDLAIHYPSLAEQKKIAKILDHYDKLIKLCEAKIDEYKDLKKACLSKMFPRNGSNVPELRFPGFIGAWEQRELGDCFDERTERSAEGELIAVTINFGVVKASELNRHDNSSEDKSNYKVVRVNDIAYNSMRMWQGASGYSQYDGILSPAYTVAIPRENINSVFFSYMFKRTNMIHEFRINSQGLTSDTWNLKFPAFSKIMAKVPKLEEQQAIGEYFTNLDRLITLHQREVEEYTRLKKAMTQLLLTGIVRVKV